MTTTKPQWRSRIWGVIAIAIGLTFWEIGDGRAFGINPEIPHGSKVGITLLGWPYIIDGVKVLCGHRPFMRNFHRYAFYVLAALAVLAGSAWLVIWLYETLSLKAMVAIGLTAAIALLVFILLELRKRPN